MGLRETIFGLAQIYRGHIKTAVNANELGLNGMHVRCLHIIANQSHCTANALVQLLGKDKAQIARLVKDMIEKGWLVKQASPSDKRSQILTLSGSGLALLQKISQLEKEIEASLLAGLSSQDVADFKRIAGLMLNNLAAS
ncbi:MAG: MarR family transcriptional regulator [Paraglaciecola sp.]|uniref:MarR family winged helix-turn-helix transcriptional regulator n=1 Tax=Pseudomonadati TaxID=3379134 RepID=UPI00273DA154|nr:MarR family transcriptional regulator [Paraglaciecola sp.]MDP5029824.1 MarR family transcriptional regulator [Paraglaciecola sp.]MDP5133275.1 MarR family transcriptional regulator [Paraglaciecola sp.]